MSKEIKKINTKQTSYILSSNYPVVGYPVLLDPLLHTREAIESLESKLEESVSSRNKKAACWEKLWGKLTRWRRMISPLYFREINIDFARLLTITCYSIPLGLNCCLSNDCPSERRLSMKAWHATWNATFHIPSHGTVYSCLSDHRKSTLQTLR